MKWKCNSCGFEQTRYFGICPRCRNGEGEEVPDEPEKLILSQAAAEFRYDGPPMETRWKEVDPNTSEMKVVRKTCFDSLNSILSSAMGMVEGQVILLGAEPGQGKSTLCSQITDEKSLYISSEENYEQVNNRMLRVNPGSGVKILNTTSIEDVLEAIRKFDGDLIIIDSLNSINFGVGYMTVAKYAAAITQEVKNCKKEVIIISQVTKSGEIAGMQAITHVVDTVLHLEKSAVSEDIIVTSSKNRFNEVGGVAVFLHGPHGLVEGDANQKIQKAEVGSCYTDTRFGHKIMTISVEALVAPAQSAYGIRKANGYNFNRLAQLVGILSYYGKMNLTYKDIYVAISSGLYTDNIAVELAMANAVLSSFYGVSLVNKASGQIRLNGTVVNGYMDGREVKHVNEVINPYVEYYEQHKKEGDSNGSLDGNV